MGKAKLFTSGCCNNLTDKQRKSIRQLCLSDDVIDSDSCRRESNNCGVSLEELISGTTFFPLRFLEYNAESFTWEQIPSIELISFSQGDEVMLIENNGYSLVVYEAKDNIQCAPSLFIPSEWEEVCRVDLPTQLILPSGALLKTIYGEYSLPSTLPPGGFFYEIGDVVYEQTGCDDMICSYVCIENIPTTQEVYDAIVSVRLADNPYFQKVICSNFDFLSCIEPRVTKTPLEGYELVRIGSKGHYVQAPVPFSIAPTAEDLDAQSGREPAEVLSQFDIDVLDGLIPPECID